MAENSIHTIANRKSVEEALNALLSEYTTYEFTITWKEPESDG